MTNPPSSRPRSSRRRRRALVLPPDAVPRITTTNGPDLTAPLAPVLTRSAHFFVLIVDRVGAMLTTGLWISSFLVALTFATIMHFLDYGRSHRATEFSGAIALPYEAAKWCLNLAIRLVPNVSRTLAKVVFISCFALCTIDFGVWCIVALYRVLFNRASPDPILATPVTPAQREGLEHQPRRPRFQRSSSKLASSSQSPSPTACGPSLPPALPCGLSTSSSSTPNTSPDLSPDLASSSDTLLSSSSHSWSSGDIISSVLTESSSDSSDTESSPIEEMYKPDRISKVGPETPPEATLDQVIEIHETDDDHVDDVKHHVNVHLVQKRPVDPAVADIKVKAVRDFVMSLADARVVPTPVLTSTTVDSRHATDWAPTISRLQGRSLPHLRTGTQSPGWMPLRQTVSTSTLMRPAIQRERSPAKLSRGAKFGPSPSKHTARPERRRQETLEEACHRHLEYYRQRESDAYCHFIACLDGSTDDDDTAHLPDDFIPPTPDSHESDDTDMDDSSSIKSDRSTPMALQPRSPPQSLSDLELITCQLEFVSLKLTEHLVLEGDRDALEEYFDYDLDEEEYIIPLSVRLANEKWRINVSAMDIMIDSWKNDRPRRAGDVTVAPEPKIKKQKKSVRWADPVDDDGLCPFTGPFRGPFSAKPIRFHTFIGDIACSHVDSDDSGSDTAEPHDAKQKARQAPSAEYEDTEIYGSGSQGSGTLFVTVEDCLGRDWAMRRRR